MHFMIVSEQYIICRFKWHSKWKNYNQMKDDHLVQQKLVNNDYFNYLLQLFNARSDLPVTRLASLSPTISVLRLLGWKKNIVTGGQLLYFY